MSQPDPSQPYPSQQSSPPPQPSGQLLLVLRKPRGPGSAAMIRPVVTIDRYPAPARWGENTYTVVAGGHVVQAAATYLWTYGHAELPVLIQPGQSVTVHYSSPVITYIAGKMGFEPQPAAGRALILSIMGVVALVVLVCIVAAVVTG